MTILTATLLSTAFMLALFKTLLLAAAIVWTIRGRNAGSAVFGKSTGSQLAAQRS